MRLELPVYATLALGAGPWLFARAFHDFRIRRLIQNTPTARIRSMAMGLVEINGDVVLRSEHQAPFSGRACAYWEVDISTRTRQRGWGVVHRASSGSPFYLRDDTGLALVYPHGADCRVQQQVEETCMGINLPECYARYMDDAHLSFRHVWRLSALRFRERILEQDQRIFVLGTAAPRARAAAITPEDALPAAEEGPHERHLRELQEQTVGVVRKGENEPVFIISQQSERELTLMLGLKAWGEMIAGPALTVFGLGYWLQFLASRGRITG